MGPSRYYLIPTSLIIDLSLLENPLTHVFVRIYCVAVDLMAQIKCYRAVLEVSGG
jgi:hypothetical protein